MAHNQIVTMQNLNHMLRPCMSTGAHCGHLYSIFELEHGAKLPLMSYSYIIKTGFIRYDKPQPYMLKGGLNKSLTALKPTFKELNFTPIAFVSVQVQGSLLAEAFIDSETFEYDLSRHEDFDVRLHDANIETVQNELKTFMRMYKFILRDKTTNTIVPMPYYVPVSDDDFSYDRIATDETVRNRFILALQRMRQNQK